MLDESEIVSEIVLLPTCPVAGREAYPELRIVIRLLSGQLWLYRNVPSQVAPACNTTTSPQAAVLIAACKSPPAATTIVAALVEVQMPPNTRIENIAANKDGLNKRLKAGDVMYNFPHFASQPAKEMFGFEDPNRCLDAIG